MEFDKTKYSLIVFFLFLVQNHVSTRGGNMCKFVFFASLEALCTVNCFITEKNLSLNPRLIFRKHPLGKSSFQIIYTRLFKVCPR